MGYKCGLQKSITNVDFKWITKVDCICGFEKWITNVDESG